MIYLSDGERITESYIKYELGIKLFKIKIERSFRFETVKRCKIYENETAEYFTIFIPHVFFQVTFLVLPLFFLLIDVYYS